MIIIGERINATRSEIRDILDKRNEAKLIETAAAQVKAGAQYIDVNAGSASGSVSDEVDSIRWAVQTLQREMETPLCIDSADPVVLEAGLDAREGRPSMINSAKAADGVLEAVLGLAKRYQAPVVALAMDESGIPNSADARMQVCSKVAQVAENIGVPLESVYFDPLVLPVSTDGNQGLTTLGTLAKIKERFPAAKTVMGLSNISFGLPSRSRLNAAFLNMAAFAGLDAAILDPMETRLTDAVKTADVLLGRDRHCRKYTRAFRNRS